MKELMVVISCDTEPDRPLFGGRKYDRLGTQEWKGVMKGMEEIDRTREEVEHKFNCDIRFSWFFRSDTQMKMIYGNDSWPLKRFDGIWRNLVNKGDEIGWHPHMWRWHTQNKRWYQEISDVKWMLNCLDSGFRDFAETMKSKPTSARMGWGFHNNETMRKIDNLGIVADLSAMPGIILQGGRGSETEFFGNCNWGGAPKYPYFPSTEDYRTSEKDKAKNLHLVEIPVTVYYISKWHPLYFFSQLLPIRVFGNSIELVKPFSANTRARFLFLTEDSFIFKEALGKCLQSVSEYKCVFSSFFHTDELLNASYVRNFRANFETLICLARKYALDIHFVTATNAARAPANSYCVQRQQSR